MEMILGAGGTRLEPGPSGFAEIAELFPLGGECSISVLFTNNMLESPKLGKEWREPAIEEFRRLLVNRIRYLEHLSSLPADWVSGGGPPPTDTVIGLAKMLLSVLYCEAEDRLQSIPRLVMGPLATGGVCIELHLDKYNAVYVSIHNDLSVEIDVQKAGHYFDWGIDPSALSSGVLLAYADITG